VFRRALRQVLMRPVDDPEVVDALLRHASFRDRAVLEKALSGRFFAPFVHQEMVTGARFEARSRWSRAALANVSLEHARESATRASDVAIRSGTFDSLLSEVRRTVAHATLLVAIGKPELVEITQAAVADIDRSIKMIGRRSMELRGALSAALEKELAAPEAWSEKSYLGVSRAEALALPLAERVDHMASVFLATGTIQVSDTVTHALIALAQNPAAAAASDEAVVLETLRIFPVNASITRQAAAAVSAHGQHFRASEPITVVPERLSGSAAFDPLTPHEQVWSFGVGPRACPARKLSLTLATAILARYRALGVSIEPGYPHRRSLAFDARATIGPGVQPTPTARSQRLLSWAKYAAVCAESYPSAFITGLPELGRVIAAGARD
jgi:cytochrome P450